MRSVPLILLMMGNGWAQEAPQTPPPAAPVQPAAPATKATAPTAAADAASPVPSTDELLTGWVEIGFRWRTDVAGSFDTYRSIVNLGAGPKLLGAEFTLTDPKHRLFDKLNVRASTWGDEPASTLHLDASKSKLYRFNADYRDLAYFNNLSSYADPLMARGITLDEQSFDTRRRLAAFSLDLAPGSTVIPYLAFDHDSNSGTGSSVFVDSGNEYPVPNRLRDSMNLYRGGVRIELRRMHVTLEEGGTTFKDDQSLFQSPGSANYGNVSTPVFGQTLDMTSLLAAYGIRGSSTYTKALFTANATAWMDVYGQFLFSQPRTTVNYTEYATGNLYLPSQIAFYSSQQYLLTSAATLPHTTGTIGAEMRPLKHVRITESWLTDRLHNAGSARSTETLLPLVTPQITAQSLAESLASNYNQAEVDVFWEALPKLTLHGGYRYDWGDGSDQILPLEGLAMPEHATLRRNVALGGLTFRPTQKLSISGDVEAGASGGVYFRTSLYNYQRIRARARYQLAKTIHLSAAFHLLDNQNPTQGLNYEYLAHQESLSLSWSPEDGKIFNFEGTYSYSGMHSLISYLAPQDLSETSSYDRENAHTGVALFTLNLPKFHGFAPKLTAGGSFFTSGGTFPTGYFQPVAKLWFPSGKHLQWFGEWRYLDYGASPFIYEGFRTTLATAGLRIQR